MRAGIASAWAVALLGASCFSPKYHNGNLRCADAGQCPENYHCAVDNTCWQNGSDPVLGEDAAIPPEADAEGEDTAQVPDDAPVLPSGPEVAVDEPSATDASLDSRLSRDALRTEPGRAETRDARAADVAMDAAADVSASADGADATGGETGSAGVPLDQLAAEYALVVCARNFACCAQADLRGKNLEGCRQNVASLLQPAVQAIADAETRGRAIYFPDRAEQCLQRIGATACEAWPLDPVTQLPGICDNAVRSLVSTGGPCRSAAECTTRLCTGASSNADGTCLPKAASGETCVQILAQNSCEPELYCESAPSNLCTATKVDGTSCAGNRECKSLTCGPAPDAGNICLPALCYSNGPLLPPACSVGGRPSAFASGLMLAAALALVLRRRKSP
jgi:hypothetical protein